MTPDEGAKRLVFQPHPAAGSFVEMLAVANRSFAPLAWTLAAFMCLVGCGGRLDTTEADSRAVSDGGGVRPDV